MENARHVEQHREPVDRTHPTFDLRQPYLTLPAVLTHYSTAILAPASYDRQGHVTKVLGTGPYEVTRSELASSDGRQFTVRDEATLGG